MDWRDRDVTSWRRTTGVMSQVREASGHGKREGLQAQDAHTGQGSQRSR